MIPWNVGVHFESSRIIFVIVFCVKKEKWGQEMGRQFMMNGSMCVSSPSGSDQKGLKFE